jgi:hypothetical protein
MLVFFLGAGGRVRLVLREGRRRFVFFGWPKESLYHRCMHTSSHSIYFQRTHLDVVQIRQPQKPGGQHRPRWEIVVGDAVGEEEEGKEEEGREGVGLGLFFLFGVCVGCFGVGVFVCFGFFWGGGMIQ